MNYRKLWLDGRIGHTTYLMFFLTFTNFIIISFNFLIEGNTLSYEFLSHMWQFSLIFIAMYIPVSILIGRWHTKTQLSTDMSIKIQSNPVLATMIRTLLDVQTGIATKEEIEESRNIMLDIEK